MLHENSSASTVDATVLYITVRFPVEGRLLPADHGYALYSAITRLLPTLHGASWLAIELISGVPWREGVIALPTRGASLYLRLPADHYASVLQLAGKHLDIEGHAAPLRHSQRAPAHACFIRLRTHRDDQKLHRSRTFP
jgi:CRISPR-associated endonuclease/helicase Cas3